MEKFKFYITNRFILAITFVLVFILINLFYTNSILPSTNTKDFWFYSGLLLLLFSILFVEPFYTSPKNIITNSLPLLVSYISIKSDFKDEILWICTFCLISMCMFFSIVALAIQSEDESQDTTNNKIAKFIRTYVGIIGEGKVIYSIVFLSVIFLYKIDLDNEFKEHYFFVMIIIWGLILIINPKSLHSKFKIIDTLNDFNSIGEIFSVQSDNMYLVKLFKDKNNVQKFDLVNFLYLMEDVKMISKGIVFDTYKLNSQRWAKILCLQTINNSTVRLSKNLIYKLNQSEIETMNKTLNIDNFVGVVMEGSKIGVIKFEYSKKNNNLQEGNLLELITQEKKILYQVIGGLTEFERLENKNESGFIVGEAIQLGIWNNENLSFEKFGWIPEINTPVYLAVTNDIELKEFNLPEFKLGVIPNTTLPSIINLDEAVSHHTALIGVTGSGKSYLSREIIKQLISSTNVICIDFTGEYKTYLHELNPTELIKQEGVDEIEVLLANKEIKGKKTF